MKRTRWYWTTTVALALGLLGGGITELVGLHASVQGVMALGYPAYVLTILGGWKVLGSAALIAPGFPRLKEWAYAGIFFNMTGAAMSHAVCHSAAWHLVVTLGFTALTVASWALRPQSRRLGFFFGAKTRDSEGT